MKQITMSEMDLLCMRDEAIAEGDLELIELCNDALNGSEEAWDDASAKWEYEYRGRLG